MELFLSNPRDWSLAAAALFDKPMKAVTGHSLRTSDPALWKRVEKLFVRRNKLVHRGEAPTDEDAKDSIDAALMVFRWLAAPENGPVPLPPEMQMTYEIIDDETVIVTLTPVERPQQ